MPVCCGAAETVFGVPICKMSDASLVLSPFAESDPRYSDDDRDPKNNSSDNSASAYAVR